MARRYQLYPEGRTKDHHFLISAGDDGTGGLEQNDYFEVLLRDDVYISQIVVGSPRYRVELSSSRGSLENF